MKKRNDNHYHERKRGVGDVTTLANPEVVDGIRHRVQSAKLASGEVPRELTESEREEIRSFGSE